MYFVYLQEAKADANQESAQSVPQNAPRSAAPAVTSGDPEVDKKIKNLRKVRAFLSYAQQVSQRAGL